MTFYIFETKFQVTYTYCDVVLIGEFSIQWSGGDYGNPVIGYPKSESALSVSIADAIIHLRHRKRREEQKMMKTVLLNLVWLPSDKNWEQYFTQDSKVG